MAVKNPSQSVSTSTTVAAAAEPNESFFSLLVAALKKFFLAPPKPASRPGYNANAEPKVVTQGSVSFVVAPGGYKIRVPRKDDVHTSIGEMMPSIKEGLNLVPPLPHVVAELLKEIQDPNATAATVGEIASSDPAMAASMIRTVNSAAFGLSRKITSVAEAVNFLGFTSVKSMVLRLQLEQTLGGVAKGNEDVEDLWIHSLVVSYIADVLARKVPGVDKGFVSTLALLHDIGKLVVQTQFPHEAAQLRGTSPGESPLQREVRILGVDHATLGANLSAKWGLPADLVQAIRFHHTPDRAFEPGDPKPLHQAMFLVQIANQLSKYVYVYQDETEIDAIDDAAYDLLNFPHDLTALLTPDVRAAASRAIFFADDGSRRPLTSIRRFLRLNRGDSARDLIDTLADNAGGQAQVEVEDVLCESLFAEEEENGVEKEERTDQEKRMRLHVAATPAGISSLCRDTAKAQAGLPLSSDARLSLALISKCILANAVGQRGEWIDVVHAVDGNRVRFAVKSPAIAFDRRFGAECDPDVAFAALDSELANVLNLGWFDSIGTSSDGSTIVFTAKAA
jgi:putative nucleotidyltransferase with HDIG domain